MTCQIQQFRADAKRLKKAFSNGEPTARNRLADVVPGVSAPKHADFLHAIARQNGHESWPKLKFTLERAAMSREQRAERLKAALFFGQHWVVRNLLEDDPELAAHNLGLQIALYDQDAVRSALRKPEAATRKIGLRSPILHLTFSKHIHSAPEKRQAMLAIAELLVAAGADVNDGYPPEPGSDHRLSALYGALGHANNMVLAAWLLDHGADPNDNESLYHATELGHHEGLKLLIRHGVRTSGTNALPRALDFDDAEAVRLLLDHGANPDEAVTGHPSGQPVDSIPALHQAARRWCSKPIAQLLLEYGADPALLWRGHHAYAMARIYGNDDVASVIEASGQAGGLTAIEHQLAECARGIVPEQPIDTASLGDEVLRLATRVAARPERLEHLKALIGGGLDPNQSEEMGLTPLHVAGWEGLPGQVGYLLSLDPDLDYRNGFGGDALGTVVHGAEHCPNTSSRDHIACARLLLDAGATLRKAEIDGCGDEAMALFLEDWAATLPD